MKVLGDVVPTTRGGRLLGAHVAYSRNVSNDLAEKRVSRGIVVAERVRWAPLPMHVRARLLSSLVLPASLYGSCVGGLRNDLMNTLTSAIMRATWGTKRKLRCREIVLTLFVQGHLVDPRQAYIYQSLCILRRFLKRHEDLRELVRRVWQSYAIIGSSTPAPGPVGIVRSHLQKLGWT